MISNNVVFWHVHPPFKLINSKLCSVSRLRVIEYSSNLQRLWSDWEYAQAGLNLCWSHIVGNLVSRLISFLENYSFHQFKLKLGGWYDHKELYFTKKWHTYAICVYKINSRFCVCLLCCLHPKSTAMVMAGRSLHLTTLFPGQAWTRDSTSNSCTSFRL